MTCSRPNAAAATVLLSIFVLIVGAMPSLAANLRYECDITKRQKNVQWISPQLIVDIPQKGQPQVFDAVIQHFIGKPVPARATKRGADLVVRWSLKGLRDSAKQAIPAFNFTARINTETNAVRLMAKPTSFPNQWTGRGTCKLRNR